MIFWSIFVYIFVILEKKRDVFEKQGNFKENNKITFTNIIKYILWTLKQLIFSMEIVIKWEFLTNFLD